LAFVLAAACSAALHLRAEQRGPRWQVYAFKPLTTALLLALAVASPAAHGAAYQWAIATGLACSLAGDVFLMLPGDRFVAGLAAFLVAHVAYAIAFVVGVPAGWSVLLAVPLALAGVLLLRHLWRHLGRMRLPVVLYAAAILAMAWSAWARGWALPTTGSMLAVAGATLFLVSDGLLALNRFGRPVAHAKPWVMVPYVGAQALIALSVGTV